MSDEVNYPTGFGLKDVVAWGNSGMTYLDESSQTIVKSPHGEENKEDIAIERRIYERLSESGGHEGLLRYYGSYEQGIRLEFACNYDLRSFLENHPEIDNTQRHCWARQIVDALYFVHSRNIIHGDLNISNILIDKHLNAKLADFGGSSLDGSDLLVAVTTSHRYPGSAQSIQADIFALGSVLYEIMTGAIPYHDLSDEEIEARYLKHEYPKTKSLGLIGDLIERCWQGRYNDCNAIITDIEAIQQRRQPFTNLATFFLQHSVFVMTITTVGVVVVLGGIRLVQRRR